MKTVIVKLASISPMIQNAISEKTLRELIYPTKKAYQAAVSRSPKEIAREKLYKSKDGKLGIPTQHLLFSLIEAGHDVKNGKKAVSTATSTSLPSFLTIEGEFLPFTNNPKWEADLRCGKLKNSKVKVAIVRPRIDTWKLVVKIQFNEKKVDVSVVKDLFKIAGMKVGLCDFRPAKRGVFGRFKLADFKIKEN